MAARRQCSVRENEVVQFTYDKWKSVKLKHHIFCYQASPAKKQFSTETDRQPSKYMGHPGHSLDIRVLASEETWRTPSLLQATALPHQGVAIFSQVYIKYMGHPGHSLDIRVLASEETWRTPSLLQATALPHQGVAIFSQVYIKYMGHPGHSLDIRVLASEETWRTPSLLQATALPHQEVAIFSQVYIKYMGHPGHSLDIRVLASEETWRTPSLLQATALPHQEVAIFSQVYIKYMGHPGHSLDIRVLASEETWRTPSLLQATALPHQGVAIFSQIHLEADPNDYLGEEGMTANEARLEILHKILGDILGLHVKDPHKVTQIDFTRGFFLGNHVNKLSLIEGSAAAGVFSGDVTLQWCARGEAPARPPAADYLPVAVYECPEYFNTVDYFDNLTSAAVGRLVIYSDVMTSTQTLANSARLGHGLAFVARRQTGGRGRGGNHWVSPPGQACVTVQLWAEQVWRRMSETVTLVQHAAALAATRAVTTLPAYQDLDIRIKWPNDIYYGREVKIGGTITTANCIGDLIYINVGTGVNISNSSPTTCINDIIARHNEENGTSLAPISIEKFIARYCSQLERILEYLDTDGGVDAFLEQYYQYWLHDNEKIRIQREDESTPTEGTICGLDAAGWLRVLTPAGELKVAPDGNTFDIMSGLVAPKKQ
ncbi:unnamed protein product [Plutella xylostella]|uniref:(diamondback moth) hypothetical protein n=1 Tax=Plutella xylostella TaxID=51655 RepID=A0A8S4ECK5_PLUXY|nr:unnamed protein product [Plutella xylostella]